MTMNRREFARILSGIALVPLARLSATDATPALPRIGVQTTLARAAEVKAAGGDFIAESVAGLIQPDAGEDVFTLALQRVREAGLPIYACNYFIGRRDLRCTGPDASHDAVLAYATRAFARAQRLGVRVIVFGSSASRSIPEGFEEARARDQFATLLAALGPRARDHDVKLAVESLQSRECNFLTKIRDVADVVQRADHPNIRITADLYHMVAEQETPDDLRAVLPWLAHLELAEVQGRRLPQPNGQDFRPFFKVLKTAGYSGAVCFEGRFESEELTQGLALLRQQWTEA